MFQELTMKTHVLTALVCLLVFGFLFSFAPHNISDYNFPLNTRKKFQNEIDYVKNSRDPPKLPALNLPADVYLPTHPLPPIQRLNILTPSVFSHQVRQNDYQTFQRLLTMCINVLDRYNITYILSDGSLLGSYILHDFLPWDDDLDIRIPYHFYPKLKQIVYQDPAVRRTLSFHAWGDGTENEFSERNLNTIYPDWRLENDTFGHVQNVSRYHRHKWYFTDQKKTFEHPWRWPFMDVFFMKENKESVWTLDSKDFTFHYKRTDIYPIHKRPFAGMWVSAPHRTRTFLQVKYNNFICQSHSWNHRRETSKLAYVAPCVMFNNVYPHVNRTRYGDGTIENVVLGDQILYTVYLNEPFSGNGKSFSIN